ncbi:MAG TPA: glycine betaine ABC transporter substrate-binding protein, partial [Roseiflexaceae bacterium]|nr:glycine betaine ABC transporter substrate-binding protein [Roseiflexaceae bacterium]
SGARPTIKIATKDFVEQYLLGELYAQLLENAGFSVERDANGRIPVLGETPVLHAAILKGGAAGGIDIYPEYTSTGLLTVLKQQPIDDPKQLYVAVKSGYEKQFQLTWLEPAPFNDAQALATTRENSLKYGIKTYSDLASRSNELVLGAAAAFLEREDGIKGLQQAYGGFEFKQIKQLGTGSIRYQALLNKEIDVVQAFGTDGEIKGYELVLLQDDKGFYPIYQAAPVIRQDVLQQNPEIAETLNKLAPKLTDEVMSALNWQVTGPANLDPKNVARGYLQLEGLLQ